MVSSDRIQITLTGGAPWGFRLSGGGSLPLTINKIRKKSQAHNQGLKEGDAVISINNIPVHDKSQDEALELVEKAGDSLSLQICRSDSDDISRDKPKKMIKIPGSSSKPDAGSVTLDGASFVIDTSTELMSPTVENPTPESFVSAESDLNLGGFKLTATVDDMSGTTYSTGQDNSSGLIMTASVDDMSSSSNPHVLASSPVIFAGDMTSSIHSAEVESITKASASPSFMAQPFVDSQVIATSPSGLSPRPPQVSPKSPIVSPKPSKIISPQQPPQVFSPKPTQSWSPQPPKPFSPQSPQAFSPQPPVAFSPQPPQPFSPQPQIRSPQAPAVSPKPMKIVSPQPPPVSPKPIRKSAHSVFDDGQTRREVTRDEYVQQSADGLSTTMVQSENTTTSTINRGPNFVKNQASAFNTIQPSGSNQTSSSTKTTTLKSTTNVTSKKGPTPFASTVSPNIQQPPLSQSPSISGSFSAGNLKNGAPPPVFKPTRFTLGAPKKEVPGLYSPASPMVDVTVSGMYKDGKENMAPNQPMFQVRNIVSDSAKSKGRETWRPNLYFPEQKKQSGVFEQPPVTSAKDDFSPYATFPVPRVKAGYSLVEDQKRKLLESQTSRSDYEQYGDQEQDYQDGHHHKKHDHRLHVFAPPVEIHADDPYGEYEYEEGPSSPDSLIIKSKKNLYSDSAFYDTPGKSYPTITEQMKLCKIIAQSLTSAANRRARGAKMFMKRKRKSNKWVHEGHSEWSSSAGDVANIHDLDSELSPDDGGSKPLMYFKIPNLKNRIGNEGKQTKMALTQEQFEKLRLNSKKCEHKAVPPDTCFDIVADLKAHKGKGGRMFEKRKERSDKFVIDERNAKFTHPQKKLENVLSQPVRQEKTPWEAAMQDNGNVDAAFSHLSEWERNQKLNQILKNSPPAKLPTTPLPPMVEAAPLPAVRSSLRSDESPHLLKGKDFNRTAKGWGGGGEYPVAERLQHISPTRSPTRQLKNTESSHSISQQENYNNKVKAWQSPGQSPYVSSPAQDWQQDQWDSGMQWNGQQDSRASQWAEPMQNTRGGGYQALKSWQTDGNDAIRYKDEYDYNYVPVDNRFGSSGYPNVAYRQPIIPGTDL